jgi:hypothetical protein
VHVYPTTVLHSVVPLEATETLADVPPAEAARLLADLGIEVARDPGSVNDDTNTRPIQLVGA